MSFNGLCRDEYGYGGSIYDFNYSFILIQQKKNEKWLMFEFKNIQIFLYAN